MLTKNRVGAGRDRTSRNYIVARGAGSIYWCRSQQDEFSYGDWNEVPLPPGYVAKRGAGIHLLTTGGGALEVYLVARVRGRNLGGFDALSDTILRFVQDPNGDFTNQPPYVQDLRPPWGAISPRLGVCEAGDRQDPRDAMIWVFCVSAAGQLCYLNIRKPYSPQPLFESGTVSNAGVVDPDTPLEARASALTGGKSPLVAARSMSRKAVQVYCYPNANNLNVILLAEASANMNLGGGQIGRRSVGDCLAVVPRQVVDFLTRAEDVADLTRHTVLEQVLFVDDSGSLRSMQLYLAHEQLGPRIYFELLDLKRPTAAFGGNDLRNDSDPVAYCDPGAETLPALPIIGNSMSMQPSIDGSFAVVQMRRDERPTPVVSAWSVAAYEDRFVSQAFGPTTIIRLEQVHLLTRRIQSPPARTEGISNWFTHLRFLGYHTGYAFARQRPERLAVYRFVGLYCEAGRERTGPFHVCVLTTWDVGDNPLVVPIKGVRYYWHFIAGPQLPAVAGLPTPEAWPPLADYPPKGT